MDCQISDDINNKKKNSLGFQQKKDHIEEKKNLKTKPNFFFTELNTE